MAESTNSEDAAELTRHLAYAEASVMLIEALLQLMIERKVLALDEVIQAVETAIETKRLLAKEGTHAQISHTAAGILSMMANSLAAARGLRAT